MAVAELKLSNPWDDKRKSSTQLPFSFDLINTRNKKMKPSIQAASLFRSVTPATKKGLVYQVAKANTCD